MAESDEEIQYVMDSINEVQNIFEELESVMDLPEGMLVAGVACTAHLIDPETNDSYYEAFVLPEGLPAHEKAGIMQFGKIISNENLENVRYAEMVSDMEDGGSFEERVMASISEVEQNEFVNELIEEYFNIRKPMRYVDPNETIAEEIANMTDEELEEGHAEIEIELVEVEVGDRILSEASLLIYIINTSDDTGVYAYKPIPKGAAKHSQAMLWNEGMKFLIDNVLPI